MIANKVMILLNCTCTCQSSGEMNWEIVAGIILFFLVVGAMAYVSGKKMFGPLE